MNPKMHISLDVEDVEGSTRFYSLLFNAAPTKVKPGYAKFDLESPSINLTMQQAAHCCLQGLSHLGIRVESLNEVLAYKQRLAGAGVKVEEEMSTVCCHAAQDKIWVKDPTGYRWEVYVFKGDVETAGAAPAFCSCGPSSSALPASGAGR